MITEENFLDFKCPYCGETVSFPQAAIGRAQQCPNCTESLIVPESGVEVGRKLPLPITTPGLILRRFNASDWSQLVELVSDEEFFGYVDGLTGQAEEDVLRWLERDSQIKLTTPNQTFCLAAEHQDGSKLIGCLGLRFIDPQSLQATLNINLHRDYQQQGFTLEAVDALLGFCFDGIKLHRVTARCESGNSAACRLFEKVGMRREGEFVKDQPLPNGEWTSTVWYAALEEEYGAPDAGSGTT